MSAQPTQTDGRFPLGRLFVVPMIIVSVIVTCAVVVVLSFGWIASDQEMPLDQLLKMLESASGAKTASVALMPRDKELWQAAQELAMRLENLETQIAAEQLPELQMRVVRLLKRDLQLDLSADEMGLMRLSFIMRAAARSRAPEAVPLLVDALGDDQFEIRREALVALAWMGGVSEARAAAPQISRALQDPDPVIRIVCCATLSNLAQPHDRTVLDAIAAAHINDEDREVRWNAALALARLGDSRATESVLEMLARSFWESQRLQSDPASGPDPGQRLTPQQITAYLIAALNAAAHLDDPSVWLAIASLTEDPSLAVAGRAKQLIEDRESGS